MCENKKIPLYNSKGILNKIIIKDYTVRKAILFNTKV